MVGLQLKIRDGTAEQLLARPVLVGWHDALSGDYSHLGRISDPQDPMKAKLTLLLSRDAETKRKYLLHFHLPVRTRRLSKNAKYFYLVIPVEQISLNIDTVHTYELPTSTSEQLRKDDLHYSEAFVRVRLGLRSAAYIIMPTLPRPLQSPLKGLPAQLLLRLKSLSAAKEMDVYMEDGAADELGKCARNYKTRSLRLSLTYSTCTKDLWGPKTIGSNILAAMKILIMSLGIRFLVTLLQPTKTLLRQLHQSPRVLAEVHYPNAARSLRMQAVGHIPTEASLFGGIRRHLAAIGSALQMLLSLSVRQISNILGSARPPKRSERISTGHRISATEAQRKRIPLRTLTQLSLCISDTRSNYILFASPQCCWYFFQPGLLLPQKALAFLRDSRMAVENVGI
ncbi:hypothetical protein B0J12DRAFT_57097 [Macrophomina phaseolina]|uniref:Uncharacterized protein n=1 Tax=Macrophomina phaseolina TaxID=35725 RepID=A0ABQ8GEW5_9PEZI|nr:hypothetical protein B0J12DRAFT_57097 [Macrophomina phaseolina]